MFSKHSIIEKLIDTKSAVLVFNNRGHDKVVHVPHASGSFTKAIRGGAAHERFVDSADDIQGAINFARRQGSTEIYLIGHSTGCQKSVYWASKRGRGVKGIVLLAPISDYSAIRKEYSKAKIARALKTARALVRKGKPHELLPSSVWGWPWIADAQRFISLYTGEGAEEIFLYWSPTKRPSTLRSVRIPILAILADQDEFEARSAKKLQEWFGAHLTKGEVVIAPKVKHSFKGAERMLAKTIHQWVKKL